MTLVLDKTLKDLGVERQAYVGGCIIGNHCDKLLIDINVDRLCSSLLPIVIQSVGDEHELHENFATVCYLKKYGVCHRIFKSAAALSVELEANIESFMICLRSKFQARRGIHPQNN